MPAPKNLGELAADKVAKRINDRLTQYPAVKLETYPPLSKEEQAAWCMHRDAVLPKFHSATAR